MAPARRHHKSQSKVVRANGLNPGDGYCVPTAWALALATDPDNTDEVARIFPHVLRKLRTSPYMRKGTWTGGPGIMNSQAEAARVLGFRGFTVREADHDRDKVSRHLIRDRFWGDVIGERSCWRNGYPTTAQWVRRNPHVRKAVLRGTGHAGYMERGPDGVVRVYNMGARKRIDHAVILDSAEVPADLAAHADPVPPHSVEGRHNNNPEEGEMSYTKEELNEKTVDEIRDVAKGMGVELIDARREANGKTPNKGHWITAVLNKQNGGKEKTPKKTKPKPKSERKTRIFRVAQATNPRTGNKVHISLNKDGKQAPSWEKRNGITNVPSWREIEAASWKEAREAFDRGEGKLRKAKK